MPTDPVNASGSDAQKAQQTALAPDDAITSHPLYKDLEEKHAAARKGMDSSNLSKKELQAQVARLKVLAGEEDTPEPIEEPQTVTKDQLREELWNLQHAKEVELYGDEEYQTDLSAGIPRDYALKTAKLRFQSAPNSAQIARQQSMSSGTATGVRNIQSVDLEGFNPEEAAKWGYTKETWLRHRNMKKERGQV